MSDSKQQIEAAQAALITVLDALKGLAPRERRRVMRAAFAFLRTRGDKDEDEEHEEDTE